MAGPWVAPDTPSTPPGPVAAAPRRERAVDAGPPVPVPLRPLTVADILDGALRAWKLAPSTMAGVAAVFVVPTQLLIGVLTRDDVEDTRVGATVSDALSATGPDDVDLAIDSAVFVVGIVVQGVALALVTAAVATLVSGWYVGRRQAFGDVAAFAARRAPALAAAWVLVHVVEAAFAVLLVVPVLVPMALYAVVTPVLAIEGIGPWRALGRSWRLTRRRFGAALGTVLLVALSDAVLSGALTAVGAIYLELDLPAAWVVNTAVSAGAMLVTVPFVAAAATLLYLDLRVRTEGVDIALAAARRFPGG